MKIKISEATGIQLDWLVASIEGRKPSHYKGVVRASAHPNYPDNPPMLGPVLSYSTDWAQGGPIIERERISTSCCTLQNEWMAEDVFDRKMYGPTPLIAGMRCFAASKLGEEVDVPEELK